MPIGKHKPIKVQESVTQKTNKNHYGSYGSNPIRDLLLPLK